VTVPYKIHRENREPVPGTHIVRELSEFLTVETMEEARQVFQDFAERRLADVYAVGHELPELLRPT
jgi:hypothetical protein